MKFLLLFLIPLAHAYDWGEREGRMQNLTSRNLTCFFDRELIIRSTVVRPGGFCLGDAIGIYGEQVFKVPNRSSWACAYVREDIICTPKDSYSLLISHLASLHNGSSKYGNMQWDTFEALMLGR